MSKTESIPAPISRAGSPLQKSAIQSLYARAIAAAKRGSRPGWVSTLRPRLGKSTATSMPSLSIASSCTSGPQPRRASSR
jgi:hypothetical protein